MDILSQIFLPILLFVLSLISGLRLSRAGQPYNAVFFNTHKLLAVGGVIIAILRLYRNPAAAVSTSLVPALILASGICVLAFFASGALMSAGKGGYRRMRTVHNIATAGLLAAVTLAVYLLASGSVVS